MNPATSRSLERSPEYLTSEQLVQLGIFSSIDAAYQARAGGHSPTFIKLRHRVLYPKQALIEFLEQRMHQNNSNSTNTEHAESCSEEKK